jgi:hypothetical protein
VRRVTRPEPSPAPRPGLGTVAVLESGHTHRSRGKGEHIRPLGGGRDVTREARHVLVRWEVKWRAHTMRGTRPRPGGSVRAARLERCVVSSRSTRTGSPQQTLQLWRPPPAAGYICTAAAAIGRLKRHVDFTLAPTRALSRCVLADMRTTSKNRLNWATSDHKGTHNARRPSVSDGRKWTSPSGTQGGLSARKRTTITFALKMSGPQTNTSINRPCESK